MGLNTVFHFPFYASLLLSLFQEQTVSRPHRHLMVAPEPARVGAYTRAPFTRTAAWRSLWELHGFSIRSVPTGTRMVSSRPRFRQVRCAFAGPRLTRFLGIRLGGKGTRMCTFRCHHQARPLDGCSAFCFVFLGGRCDPCRTRIARCRWNAGPLAASEDKRLPRATAAQPRPHESPVIMSLVCPLSDLRSSHRFPGIVCQEG